MGNGFLLCVALGSLFFTASATYVSVASNGYQDVVIRVDENVGTDCQSAVKEIKVIQYTYLETAIKHFTGKRHSYKTCRQHGPKRLILRFTLAMSPS